MKLPILTTTRIAKRTDGLMQDSASHCTLHYTNSQRTAQMTVTYSMGSAHKQPPTALDVLGSLFSDASCVGDAPGQDFYQFCDELGYDQDSRKTEKTYKACQSISVRLHKLLGSDHEALRQHCESEGV